MSNQTGRGAQPASSARGTESFLGVKQLVCDADSPPPSSAKVLNGLELYLYLYSVPAQACRGGYWVSPGGKAGKAGADHPPPCNTEILNGW